MMQRYGISDLGQLSQGNVGNFLKKYPDLLVSFTTLVKSNLKCEGRVLRRDTERLKRIRKLRKQPNFRLKQFESIFFQAMDQKTLLFICPICRNILTGPVTVECGHTFCGNCLITKETDEFCSKCFVCDRDLVQQKRCVNVLVQELVNRWKERNKCNSDIEMTLFETEDILGMKPRYLLRSGYAGLQFDNATEEKISRLLHEENEKYPRHRNEKPTRRFGNLYKSPLREICSDHCNCGNYDHFQDSLDNFFKEVDVIKEEALKSNWNCINSADLECILCSRCLLDPVTTQCGHTFCRDCLIRVLDHGLSCPLCMATLSVRDYSRGTTEVLQQAIKIIVPEELSARMTLNWMENSILEKSSDIPVFVCTNAFPGVACPLYVYEPRYRLLSRRCIQSLSKTFAMAGKEPNGGKFVQYGTILEIRDAVSLEDGRIILTTVGLKRYRIISRGEQDGYDTARVQYIKDSAVPAEKLPELVALHDRAHSKALRWVRSLTPRVLAEAERHIGSIPDVEPNWPCLPDGPSWTWWLIPILPLNPHLQVGFLSTTSLEKRLRAIDKMMEHMMKIQTRALDRGTVPCSHEVDPTESCAETDRSFEMPYNNHH